MARCGLLSPWHRVGTKVVEGREAGLDSEGLPDEIASCCTSPAQLLLRLPGTEAVFLRPRADQGPILSRSTNGRRCRVARKPLNLVGSLKSSGAAGIAAGFVVAMALMDMSRSLIRSS